MSSYSISCQLLENAKTVEQQERCSWIYSLIGEGGGCVKPAIRPTCKKEKKGGGGGGPNSL